MSLDNTKPLTIFITAHCDDAELWAGGTISRYIVAGWRIIIAIAHHDAQRREEAIRSAQILGAQPVFREINKPVDKWILELIMNYQPAVLFTHQKEDLHFEHNAVLASTIVALTKYRERKKCLFRWYSFDTYYSSKMPCGCPVIIDITDYFEKKCAALKCHLSQNPEQLVEMSRHMNALHGQKIRVGYGEAFYPFNLLGHWPRLRDLP